jgi:uncharacterized protein (DUF952 family)
VGWAEPNPLSPERVYKVLTPEQWDHAKTVGDLAVDIDRQDGFVHLSTARQLAGTLQRYFAKSEEVFLLQIPCAALGTGLMWDAPSEGDDRVGVFPHFYGPMPPSWVEKRWKLKRGAFDLPRELLNQAEPASPQ